LNDQEISLRDFPLLNTIQSVVEPGKNLSNNANSLDDKIFHRSISGRLRTASDLEEWGWVSRDQKGIIKDLIISGDSSLQNALDKVSKLIRDICFFIFKNQL